MELIHVRKTMTIRPPVTNKEFAREVFIGTTIVVCLFAIFLFVAIQNSTGRSLSPLAYLWPDKEEQDESKPVEVFGTDEDRRQAMQELQEQYPFQEMNLTSTDSDSFNTTSSERSGTGSIAIPEGNKSKVLLAQALSSQQGKDPQVRSHDDEVVPGTNRSPRNPSRFPVVQADFSNSSPKSFKSGFVPQKTDSQTGPPPSRFDNPPRQFAPKDSFSDKGNSNSLRELGQTNSFPPSSAGRNKEPDRKTEPIKTGGFDQTQKFDLQNRDTELKDHTRNENSDSPGTRKEALANSLKVIPKRDDSFFTLSTQYYGDGKYFRELAEFNGNTDQTDQLPNPVFIPPLNDLLKCLGKDANQADSEKQPPIGDQSTESYRTRANETTFDIAREKLGSASRYLDIIQLNKTRLPENCDAQTRLPADLQLTLPKQ